MIIFPLPQQVTLTSLLIMLGLSLVRIYCVAALLKGTFLGFPFQRSSQRIKNLVVHSTEVLVFNREYYIFLTVPSQRSP